MVTTSAFRVYVKAKRAWRVRVPPDVVPRFLYNSEDGKFTWGVEAADTAFHGDRNLHFLRTGAFFRIGTPQQELDRRNQS
jgi:hypothetical protein